MKWQGFKQKVRTAQQRYTPNKEGMERLGISKEQTCVVGDRIYTDVKSGLNAGITGILVMSGETTPEILAQSQDKPHLVLEDAGEILAAIR